MADTRIGNQKSPKPPEPAAVAAAEDAPAAELVEPAVYAGPTREELEEELQDRENALAAREARLAQSENRMQAMMDRMERLAAGKGAPLEEDEKPKILYDHQGREIPSFARDLPHGIVIGDPDAGYVQNGHRFSKDGRYICEEPRGTGKPFNIALLGVVKVLKAA